MELSQQAIDYLNSERVSSVGTAYHRVPETNVEGAGRLASVVAQAERFVETYGGLHFDVPGGLLEGALTLAARDPVGLIRRTTDGASAFLAADHDTAQCAFVISETRAFGSSWSDEFGLLFDSVEHVIESLACWERMRGWIYVSIFSGTPGDVVPAIRDLRQEISLGSTSRWWFGRSTAVVVEPYLTPTASPSPQVTVLARDLPTADHLPTTLAPIAAFTSGLVAARLCGRVGADD